MADAFISYAREDASLARQLATALTSDGVSVWGDWLIPADARWEATIENELHVARVVVVLWSRHSVPSENVRTEARHAKATERLVQVFLDDSNPPLFFGEYQGLGLVNWDGSRSNHYMAVLEAARGVIAGTAQTKQVIGEIRQRALGEVIDENDPRYLTLSPVDRLSLTMSPLDVLRTDQFKRKLALAKQRTRLAGVSGGPLNWILARFAIASVKDQCRRDEAWHRRHIRNRYRNEIVRELQLSYVIDVFDDRLESIRALERGLGLRHR